MLARLLNGTKAQSSHLQRGQHRWEDSILNLTLTLTYPLLRWEEVRWEAVQWEAVRWEAVRWEAVRWEAVRWSLNRGDDGAWEGEVPLALPLAPLESG